MVCDLSVHFFACERSCETPVSPLTYSSDELRELNTAFSRGVPTTTTINIPKELNRRKRGKAGGLRRRIRACKQKPYLPSVIMGNVQSLINKIDEISENFQYFHDFRTASVMSFTEIVRVVMSRKTRSLEFCGEL